MDFDSPWKEALQLFLDPCLALLFPSVHEAIDWSKGYECYNYRRGWKSSFAWTWTASRRKGDGFVAEREPQKLG